MFEIVVDTEWPKPCRIVRLLWEIVEGVNYLLRMWYWLIKNERVRDELGETRNQKESCKSGTCDWTKKRIEKLLSHWSEQWEIGVVRSLLKQFVLERERETEWEVVYKRWEVERNNRKENYWPNKECWNIVETPWIGEPRVHELWCIWANVWVRSYLLWGRNSESSGPRGREEK